MSEISFQEEEYQVASRNIGKPTSKLVDWVMDHSGGVLKNEAQVQLVLIIFAVLALLLAFYLLATSGPEEVELVAPPGRVIEYPDDGPPRLRPI